MSKVHVVAKRDFLESLTVARPLVALAELVWNGFDAQSERVQIPTKRQKTRRTAKLTK
jgi:hypothetical protein